MDASRYYLPASNAHVLVDKTPSYASNASARSRLDSISETEERDTSCDERLLKEISAAGASATNNKSASCIDVPSLLLQAH